MRWVATLFSIFLPGCGQLYNGHIVRGILFLVLEIVINIGGNINTAIHLDFMGHHDEALAAANFSTMLFYPPFYVFATWDAFYHARPDRKSTRLNSSHIQKSRMPSSA